MSRLCLQEKSEVEVNKLYTSFKFERIESGCTAAIPGMQMLLQHLVVVYPQVKRIRKRDKKT